MKKIDLLICALLLATSHAQAQTSNADHASHHPAAQAAPAQTSATMDAMTEGEVRNINKAAGKITLRHGPIRNLDMPPMTMVFQVRDAALLDKVQAGDAVRFSVDKIDGAYVLLSIEPRAK